MDVALKMAEDLRERGFSLLFQWVEGGLREDLHLDFKRKSDPENWRASGDDRRNMSKALSGFSNSDGGLLLWGIGAPGSGGNERELYPIKDPQNFAEVLDSYISRLVSPGIDGALNFVIRDPFDKERGYVVSYIPKSPNSPHRSEAEGLKHYYKRYGDSFRICEHYELEYMFGVRHHPVLKLFWDVEVEMSDEGLGGHYGILRIGLRNQGRAQAESFCLKIRYDKKSGFQPQTKTYAADLVHYSAPQKSSKVNFEKVTARAKPSLVIYPNDQIYVFLFKFAINPDTRRIVSSKPFELYYETFASAMVGQGEQTFKIPIRKVAERMRKKWTN